MNKIINYLYMGLALLFGASAMIYGALSYFVRSSDANNTIYDGLGRQLEITPTLIKFLYVNDTMWPGFFWAIFDWVLFFGLLGLAYLMFNLYGNSENKIKK